MYPSRIVSSLYRDSRAFSLAARLYPYLSFVHHNNLRRTVTCVRWCWEFFWGGWLLTPGNTLVQNWTLDPLSRRERAARNYHFTPHEDNFSPIIILTQLIFPLSTLNRPNFLAVPTQPSLTAFPAEPLSNICYKLLGRWTEPNKRSDRFFFTGTTTIQCTCVFEIYILGQHAFSPLFNRKGAAKLDMYSITTPDQRTELPQRI